MQSLCRNAYRRFAQVLFSPATTLFSSHRQVYGPCRFRGLDLILESWSSPPAWH
jgi:hypothetical protein